MIFGREYFIWVAGLVLLIGTLGLPATSWGQDTRSHSLSVQYHRAETAWRTGSNLVEAKIRLDHVVEELPDDLPARKLRAQVLMELGRFDEALEDAEHAAKLAPEDGEARLIHAEAARVAGEEERAVEELKAAADNMLDDAMLHLRLSWNAYMLEELEQAEAYARTSLSLNESDAAFYHLARIFLHQDRIQQAVRTLERGFKMEMVEPMVVQRDSVLRQVADHPLLRSFMPDR